MSDSGVGRSIKSRSIFEALGDAYLRDFAISLYNQWILERWKNPVEQMLECRRLFQSLYDLFWISECDQVLIRYYSPDDEQNLFYIEEYLALKKEIGDLDGEGWAYLVRGELELCWGNTNRAIELVKQGLDCFERIGNRSYEAITRNTLACYYLTRGDYAEALHHWEQVRQIVRELNDPRRVPLHLILRADIAFAMQEFELVTHYCGLAIQLDQKFDELNYFYINYLLGWVALSRGEDTLARSYFRKYLVPEAFAENPVDIFRTIQTLGALAARERRFEVAVTLFATRHVTRSWLVNFIFPIEREQFAQALEAARLGLREAAFSAAWEAGQAMTIEQVRQYALEFIDGSTTPVPGS
jgi:tetratricopeptide (TPR) repeat protein